MQRDNWKCVKCHDGSTELNVHHTEYKKGRKPWEYEDALLVTLCKPCHGAEHTPLIKPYTPPALSSTDLSHERIKGVVINWTDEREDGYEPLDFIPWTGKKLRENSEKYDEIYVCINRDGNEFLIDASCGKAFLFPLSFEVDNLTFRKFCVPASPPVLVSWLNTIRELVRNGVEIQ